MVSFFDVRLRVCGWGSIKYGTKTVRMRTRKPETVCKVVRKALRSVGYDTRLAEGVKDIEVEVEAEEGSGESTAGLADGNENACFRTTAPRRVDGSVSISPVSVKVLPVIHSVKMSYVGI